MPRRRKSADVFPQVPSYRWVKQHYASADTLPVPGFPLWVERTRQVDAVPPHTHDFVELVYVVHGQGFHAVHGAGEPQIVVPGDCFLIAPGESHAYAGNQELDLINVLFLPDVVADEYRNLKDVPGLMPFFLLEPLLRKERGFRDRLHLGIGARTEIEQGLATMMTELNERPIGFTQRVRARFVELLVLLARAFQNQRQATTGASDHHAGAENAIQQAISVMEQEYAGELYLDQIAHQVFLSPGHFADQFRKVTGVAPWDYLIRIRLEAAKRLLASTTRSVTAIALEVGFGDASHFTKSFRAREGMTPSAWRKSR